MALRLLLLALLPQAAAPTDSDLSGLRVGHWVEVRGELEGDTFVGTKLEAQAPAKYHLLIGTVAATSRGDGSFLLLDQPVFVDEETEYERLAPDELLGRRVKLEGRWRHSERLDAREISARGPGRDRVGGRIDELTRVPGGLRLRVMHLAVFVPDDVDLVLEAPLAELPLAPAPRPRDVLDTLTDDVDEDDLFGEGTELLEDLWINGQLEWRSTFEENLNLDDDDEEDRADHDLSGRLRLTWEPAPTFAAVGEVRYQQRWRRDDEDGSERSGDGRLGETFAYWRDPGLGLDVQIGRQDFDDQREWIYDQNLDAARVFVRRSRWDLELSASTVFSDAARRDREAFNLIGYLSNGQRRRHLALWAVYRDIDPYLQGGVVREENNLHVGVRALGKWLPQQRSWVDVAFLTGERDGSDVRAWGYDVGTTWSPPSLEPVSLTIGYAFGTGDRDPATGKDRTFRQTGLQDNNAKFAGVTSFRYYGELVDPELANLGILTLGIGARVARATSVDLVFHHYLQDKARPELIADLDQAPDGLDADIGWELDLILGCRRWKSWDLELVGAAFEPGDAFADDDTAYLGKVQLRYRF